MEIQNDPKRRDQRSEKVQRNSSSSSSGKGQSTQGFQQVMSAGASQIRESLDALMKDVDSCASDLLQDPNEAKLTRYTTSVRSFLRKAQGQAYAVSKNFDKHNRLYTLVREVDSQLANLADQVLVSQGRALEMAARIQEIRGILLDMFI
ncbi:MAG: DUF327 family protein [Candidatus Sericytochromatia bacterium]